MELGEILNQDRWNIIDAMFQEGDITLDRVVQVFFTGAQASLERICAGRDQNRRDWCVSASHSLKSSSANLGLERVSVLSHHLETNVEAMSQSELDQLIQSLSCEIEEARRLIFNRRKETL